MLWPAVASRSLDLTVVRKKAKSQLGAGTWVEGGKILDGKTPPKNFFSGMVTPEIFKWENTTLRNSFFSGMLTPEIFKWENI